MSIATEIERLIKAKADIKAILQNKGVKVDEETLDGYSALIEKIGISTVILSGLNTTLTVKTLATHINENITPTVEGTTWFIRKEASTTVYSLQSFFFKDGELNTVHLYYGSRIQDYAVSATQTVKLANAEFYRIDID